MTVLSQLLTCSREAGALDLAVASCTRLSWGTGVGPTHGLCQHCCSVLPLNEQLTEDHPHPQKTHWFPIYASNILERSSFPQGHWHREDEAGECAWRQGFPRRAPQIPICLLSFSLSRMCPGVSPLSSVCNPLGGTPHRVKDLRADFTERKNHAQAISFLGLQGSEGDVTPKGLFLPEAGPVGA